jgi:hypothetical protein
LFKEVDHRLAGSKYDEARNRLEEISKLLNRAESVLREQLKRYMDQAQIAEWRRLWRKEQLRNPGLPAR